MSSIKILDAREQQKKKSKGGSREYDINKKELK